MQKKIAIALISLMFLISIAQAFETLTKNNFAEPIIEPKLKDYYMPGEEISFNFTIQPKTEDDAKLIGGSASNGRLYEFNTSLDSPTLKVMVEYASGGSSINQVHRNYIDVDVYNPEGGVSRIEVKVKGIIPQINSRVAEIIALYVSIQDAEKDAIEPVRIKVVNLNAFSSYISQLEGKYKDLEGKMENLESKGALISDLKIKLKDAKDKIDEGKNLFNSKNYLDADKSLREAESLLNDAENLVKEKDVSLLIDDANNKLNKMFTKMSELEVLINDLKSKGVSTLEYEVKLNEYKQHYTELKSKIMNAEDYLKNGLYDDAKIKAEEVVNSANKYLNELNTLTSQISVTPTQNSNFNLNFVNNFVKWVSKNRDKLVFYGGSSIGFLLIALIVYKGVKRYRRRKKWDELK